MARSELPKAWKIKRLSEVAPVVTETIQPNNWPKKEFNYVSLEHIESHTGRLNGFKPTKGEEIKSSKARFTTKHVLYGKLRPYLNKVFVPDFEGIATSEILTLEPSSELLNRKFLAFYLRSPEFVAFASANVTGSRMPRVSIREFKAAEIPVPPLEEQRRIVARIEELLSRIERAKSLRQKSLAETSALLPSTLHGVFSKAEEDVWEKQPIEELVKDIRTGTTPPSKEEKYYGGDIQWFTPGDLGEDKFLVKSARTITHTAIEEGKAKIFEKGTILFVGIGATLGKVGIAGKDASSNQQITGMLFKDAVVPDFAYYWFRYKHDYIRVLSPAATLPIINQDGLGSLAMEYPSVDEQRRIVAYFDSLQEKVNELQHLQSATEKEIDQLTQSILSKAFKGEL